MWSLESQELFCNNSTGAKPCRYALEEITERKNYLLYMEPVPMNLIVH